MFNGYTGESSKPRLRIYIYPGIQGGFIQCFHSRHIILFSYFIRTSPAMLMWIYPGEGTLFNSLPCKTRVRQGD